MTGYRRLVVYGFYQTFDLACPGRQRCYSTGVYVRSTPISNQNGIAMADNSGDFDAAQSVAFQRQ